MHQWIRQQRAPFFYRVFSCVLSVVFLCGTINPSMSMAQSAGALTLPLPGTMVTQSPVFAPATIKGIKIFPDNPLRFNFIINPGDSGLKGDYLEAETSKLVKYFLASLTVPEEDLWVNLNPNEQDRIVPDAFGQTEMGRDLLAQDYLLKQLTASLMYPEDDLGKNFWARVQDEAVKQFGITDIPMDTFNKVWIVPEKAVVYENGNAAFVEESRLKVMLESDYQSVQGRQRPGAQAGDPGRLESGELAKQIIREIILPEIEKEVNEGRNFAQLRQIYNSLILATWYKRKIQQSLLGQAYVDRNKTVGVDITDKMEKEKIWARYVELFKKGVYDYIKEDIDPVTQEVVPRRYFSGGAGFTNMDMKPAFTVHEGSAAEIIQHVPSNPDDLEAVIDVAPSLQAGEVMLPAGFEDELISIGKRMREINTIRLNTSGPVVRSFYSAPYNDKRIRYAVIEGVGENSQVENRRKKQWYINDTPYSKEKELMAYLEGRGLTKILEEEGYIVNGQWQGGMFTYFTEHTKKRLQQEFPTLNLLRVTATIKNLTDTIGNIYDILGFINERRRSMPGKRIAILDWGCGDGSSLKQLSEFLQEQGIDDVDLLGFSEDFYEEWRSAPSNITFLFGQEYDLKELLKGREIDLITSFYGISHLMSLDSGKLLLPEYIQYLGDLLSEAGEMWLDKLSRPKMDRKMPLWLRDMDEVLRRYGLSSTLRWNTPFITGAWGHYRIQKNADKKKKIFFPLLPAGKVSTFDSVLLRELLKLFFAREKYSSDEQAELWGEIRGIIFQDGRLKKYPVVAQQIIIELNRVKEKLLKGQGWPEEKKADAIVELERLIEELRPYAVVREGVVGDGVDVAGQSFDGAMVSDAAKRKTATISMKDYRERDTLLGSVQDALKSGERVVLEGNRLRYVIEKDMTKNRSHGVYKARRIANDGSPEQMVVIKIFNKSRRSGSFMPVDLNHLWEFFNQIKGDALAESLFARMHTDLANLLLLPFRLIEMKFVDGKRLMDITDKQRRIEILAELIEKLAYVEEKYSVFHGDLMSHNVMIDGQGHPRLIDWDSLRYFPGKKVKKVHWGIKYKDIYDIGVMLLRTYNSKAFVYSNGLMKGDSVFSDIDISQHKTSKISTTEGVPEGILRVVRKAVLADPGENYESLDELWADLKPELEAEGIDVDPDAGILAQQSDQAEEGAGRPVKATAAQNGGIDLNTDRLDIQTRSGGDGEAVFNIDPEILQLFIDAPGVVPVIIDIHPLQSLPQFLGATFVEADTAGIS